LIIRQFFWGEGYPVSLLFRSWFAAVKFPTSSSALKYTGSRNDDVAPVSGRHRRPRTNWCGSYAYLFMPWASIWGQMLKVYKDKFPFIPLKLTAIIFCLMYKDSSDNFIKYTFLYKHVVGLFADKQTLGWRFASLLTSSINYFDSRYILTMRGGE